jgi:tetratricopeptide (TPR) repeat protein
LENTVGAYDDAIRNAIAIEAQGKLPAAVRASAAGVAGLSYESLGQPEAAILHLRQAIQLDPSQENSYLSLAFLLEKTAKYADAVDVLEQGRKHLAQSVALLLPLGSDLVLAERYANGIDVLKELVNKSPDEYEAYVKLADAFHKIGATDDEVKVLRDLASRKPDYPGVHLLIARAMFNSDPPDYPKTLDELVLAGPNAETFYLQGRVYLATGRNEEAVNALRHAIALEPMDPGPYYQLGRLYEKLGQRESAKDVFERMQYLKTNAAR